MQNQQQREELRSELRRQGLPRAYVERLLGELDDHFTDLIEERNSSMGAARKLPSESVDAGEPEHRLGEATQLAIFAAEQYHSRSFWGRHPVLTFVILPLPLLLITMISFSAVAIGIGHGIHFVCANLLGIESPNPRDFLLLQGVVIACWAWYFLVVPSLVTGFLLCRAYRRNSLHWRWPVAGCALVACAMALTTVSFRVASIDENGMFTIGFYAANSVEWILLTLLPKFAIAFGIGLLLVRRAQQQLAVAL